MQASLSYKTSRDPKPVVKLGGSVSRQASWADIEKFAGTRFKGWEGHRDMVELYNWNRHNHNPPKNWRPKSLWASGGDTDLYAKYGWDPVTVHMTPIRSKVVDQSYQPVALVSNTIRNDSKIPTTNTVELKRSISSTVSVNSYSEQSLGVTKSMHVSVSATPGLSGGVGGEIGFGFSSSFQRTVGTSDTKSQSKSLDNLVSTQVSLVPGEKVQFCAQANEGQLKIRIYYKVTLSGGIAADYGGDKFDGHHYWCHPITDVLKKNGKDNYMETHEDFSLNYYGGIEFIQKSI